jgi:hypothetical protein
MLMIRTITTVRLWIPSILKGDVEVPDGAVPFVRTVAKAFVDAKANH